MLLGRIVDDQPFVPIVVAWKLNVQNLIALVDTGFTGELKVSPQTARELGIEVTDIRKVSQADGRPTFWETGLAYVSLEGEKVQVSVLIGEGLPRPFLPETLVPATMAACPSIRRIF